MNARERFLIVLLAAVVILLGGYKLLIEPAFNQLKQTSSDYQAAKDQLAAVQNNIANEAAVRNSNETLKKNITEKALAFFPELTNDKIQIYFQNLANHSEITYTTLTMSKPLAAQIAIPSSENNELTYPAKGAATTLNELESGSASSPSAPVQQSGGSSAIDTVEQMSVSIQFESSYSKTMVYINQIKESNRLARISALNITNLGGNKVRVNITVDCYGIKKFTSGDSLSQDNLSSQSGKANPFS